MNWMKYHYSLLLTVFYFLFGFLVKLKKNHSKFEDDGTEVRTNGDKSDSDRNTSPLKQLIEHFWISGKVHESMNMQMQFRE